MRNTEALDIAALIHEEYLRASLEGVTISQQPEPRDSFLAGWLSCLKWAERTARTLTTKDF